MLLAVWLGLALGAEDAVRVELVVQDSTRVDTVKLRNLSNLSFSVESQAPVDGLEIAEHPGVTVDLLVQDSTRVDTVKLRNLSNLSFAVACGRA